MTGAAIAQLLIIYGPHAINFIQQLASNWNKEMSVAEIDGILALASKSYDQYVAEAKANFGATQ